MNSYKIKFVFLFCCVAGCSLYSQTPLVDSLIRLVNKTTVDTLKVKLYGDICWELMSVDMSKSELYAEKQLSLATEINNDVLIAQAESDIGNVLNRKGDFENALIHYYKAVALRQKLKQPLKVAGVYNNIATVLMRQNKFNDAIEINFKSLKIFEEAGDKNKQSVLLGNIGNIYNSLSQTDQALVYFRKGLVLSKGVGNVSLEANSLANIGVIKFDINQYDSALFYFYETEKILLKNNLLYDLGAVYNNIGKTLVSKKEYVKAIEYYEKGLQNRIQFEDEFGIALSNSNIASLYIIQKDYDKALNYLLKSEPIFKKNKAYINLKDCYVQMATASELKGDMDAAVSYYKLLNDYKDSIYTKESADQILEMNAKYETEKKDQENKLLNTQNALSEKTIKQQRTFSFFIGIALLLLASLAFFIFRGLKQQRKANRIISLQKQMVEHKSHIIEEKHKEITDSINYAERIQRALLASKKLLDDNLSNYFILFKPRDVVSGDFYWATRLTNNQFVIVTADSTGHGVPGAIMSILNIACLKETMTQGITSPDLILNETRRLIIENLKNDGSAEGGKDGMDGSVLSFDFENNTLLCAAANNPVWIMRGHELIEIKADRMPIGKHEKDNYAFTLQTKALEKGDMVYTLTDGYADQFGGVSGKKYKYKALQELLLTISHESMENQKQKLNSVFESWKGNLEQVDDVCLIGIRI
jgi:serine phosphatase RsbU (regulator of sigma subunit)